MSDSSKSIHPPEFSQHQVEQIEQSVTFAEIFPRGGTTTDKTNTRPAAKCTEAQTAQYLKTGILPACTIEGAQ